MISKRVISRAPPIMSRAPVVAPKKSILDRIKGFLKQTQIISKGLSGLSGISSLSNYKVPLSLASSAASHYGFGRKRKRVVRKRRAAPRKVRRVVRKRRVTHRKK